MTKPHQENSHTILRANAGFIRDAYIDEDTINQGHRVLVLRQTKFASDQADAATRSFRLPEQEVEVLLEFMFKEFPELAAKLGLDKGREG